MSLRAGILQLKINGAVFDVKGNVTYSLGKNTRESLIGPSGVQGYKETPMPPFFETELTDSGDLDLSALGDIVGATAVLNLANGKTIAFREAFSTNPDGLAVTTEEAVIAVRFEAESADEI